MYLDFFGLKKAPFKITPDTRLFFEGSDRGAVLHTLCYAITQGEGIMKVVGEVGTGKTMICRMLTQSMRDNIDWVYLANPSLSPEHTLHAIAYDLGINLDDSADKLTVMRMLHETLLERYKNNRQVVVLVEEAQGMPIESLEEIRLLSNLETDDQKLMQIVLFGQPELDDNLSQMKIRQLKERITHSVDLQPLNVKGIQEYLNFRLRAVGYTGPDLFDIKTSKAIYRFSNGLIRRVNIIADKMLLIAFTQKRHQLTQKDVRESASDSEFKTRTIWWPFAASIFCGLIVLSNLTINHHSNYMSYIYWKKNKSNIISDYKIDKNVFIIKKMDQKNQKGFFI